jgi:hypothetical protein
MIRGCLKIGFSPCLKQPLRFVDRNCRKRRREHFRRAANFRSHASQARANSRHLGTQPQAACGQMLAIMLCRQYKGKFCKQIAELKFYQSASVFLHLAGRKKRIKREQNRRSGKSGLTDDSQYLQCGCMDGRV